MWSPTRGRRRVVLKGWRFILLSMAMALLSACGAPPASNPRPVLTDSVAVCLADLDQRHVVYDRSKDFSTPQGCGIQGAIRIRKDATEWKRSVLMACSLEQALDDFEIQVLMPAAQKYFHQNVRSILNVGAYNCRAERSEHSSRLSQHALGKAIDITGFQLEDGTVISVLRDWRGKGDKSDFLHEVAQGACGVFNVVLTPNSNALHRDHIHADIGPYKLCGY